MLYKSIFNGQLCYYICNKKISHLKGFSVSKVENGWWTHLKTFKTKRDAMQWVDECINYRLEKGV